MPGKPAWQPDPGWFDDMKVSQARSNPPLNLMTKIMLIEDDSTMLSLLETLLEFEGYAVVGVNPSIELDEVLGAVQQEMPDLLLLDVNLRKLDGIDILRALRRTEGLKHIRVLMNSGKDYQMRCYQEGADGFILKPYMPEDLINQIRQLLQSK
jgi:DNA-binding response OmpR family regulator